MTKIILATTSPYRKELFSYLGLDFTSEDSNVNEKFEERPADPEELVKCLSKLKAEAVAKNKKEGIVVGFDSVSFFNNNVLEKPESREEAFNRLKAYSGKTHYFYTGIHMINVGTGKRLSKVVKTEVLMRHLTDQEINKYLDQDPKVNTYSLGYNPLSFYSSAFISRIIGSYNNIMGGNPLEIVVEMLALLGFKL